MISIATSPFEGSQRAGVAEYVNREECL